MTQAGMASAEALKEAFPDIKSGIIPFGSRIVVQFRTPKGITSGGIILTDDARDTVKWNTQVAKVIAIGPLAFKSRDKMADWPEGAWAKVGDFVRVNKYGGDRWEVAIPGRGDDKAVFAVFDDLNLIGKVDGDPLAIKAYV